MPIPDSWGSPTSKRRFTYCRPVPAPPTDDRRLGRLTRVAAADHDDDRALRHAVVSELARELPFTAYAWLLTDPETEVGISPLADLDGLAGPDALPALIALKYGTSQNRWTSLTGAAGLHAATGGHLDASALWRDLLAGWGVVDVASIVFRDEHGCWGFLDLWRAGDQSPFSPAEITMLTRAVAPITTALRRMQSLTFARPPATAGPAGPVVMVLGPDLTVRAQTPETDAFLRALLPPSGQLPPVPAAAYNVGAQLLAVEAGIDDHPPQARVHVAGGRWLTVRAARIAADHPRSDDDIAVTVEPTTGTDRLLLCGQAAGLTPREMELLGFLASGASTRDVATQMFVSENTVQDHLKSIFAKTGTRNRRTLLARATGR